MSRIKFKQLSRIFGSAGKVISTTGTKTATETTTVKPFKLSKSTTVTSIVGDAIVNKETTSSTESGENEIRRESVKNSVRKGRKVQFVATQDTATGEFISNAINEGDPAVASKDIGTMLWRMGEVSDPEVADGDDDSSEKDNTDDGFYSFVFTTIPLRRKELCRDRKIKWIFKNTQKMRFDKLISLCMGKHGSGSMFELLTKLGRGSGLKEYNAFIRGCVKTARQSKDEKTQTQNILQAYRILVLMKQRGFCIEEAAFGPLLMYLIDNHLEEDFELLLEIVKEEDVSLHPRLGYYEMMFWIEMNNEGKVQELCNEIATSESEMGSLLHENYLLALCERDRKKELLKLLDIIDITRVSSVENIAVIFRSLGRLALEAFAEMFVLALKDCDYGAESISNVIYAYASSLENLAVEDAILKFRDMHEKLDLSLVASSYENLITFCCDSLKVHLALELVDEMGEAGLTLSTGALNAICHACDETCEYILVRRIYSMLDRYKFTPNCETYRSIINLNVRMKDFENAYAMLKDLDRLNLKPTASMYNAILGGYFREKNMHGVLRVLKQMKEAGVKPDSHTFSYIISQCTYKEDIAKYREELKNAGLQATKHVYMALVKAYASSGQFEKAKEVILDEGISPQNLTEVKSALVSALAFHGQIRDALEIYESMKGSGLGLEPKAVISLIENQQSEGKLNLMLELLEELHDLPSWVDGCCRVILYCVRHNDLRTAVDLLKKLTDKFQDDELTQESIFDEVFSKVVDMKPLSLQIGTDLLIAIREDLGLRPSRKSLDFLLSACVRGGDLEKAQLVWKEYETADLPHNILSLLRMYQAYLVSGHLEEAKEFLKIIPQDDPHVRSVIHASRLSLIYTKKDKKKTTKTKEKTKTKTKAETKAKAKKKSKAKKKTKT